MDASHTQADDQRPADYEEYRQRTEEFAEEFLTRKTLLQLLFGRSEKLFQRYPPLTRPPIHRGSLLCGFIAMIVGIATWIWLVLMMNSPETPLCSNVFISLILASAVTYMLLVILLSIPKAIRFLRHSYPWKLVGAFFAFLIIPTVLAIAQTILTTRIPLGLILRGESGVFIWWALAAIMMGMSAAALAIRLTCRTLLRILVVAIVSSTVFCIASLFLGSAAIIGPSWKT
jgi:hypothetical protein